MAQPIPAAAASRDRWGAEIPEYWIVDLVHDRVEIHRDPDPAQRRYRERLLAERRERVELVSLRGVQVANDDLLLPV